MNIADIKIGDRHRRDMGDLAALAQSIKAEGLLQPIGVTETNELVFGARRLLACRDHLGWTEIDARVVNVTSIANGEYAENEMRKDFTVTERVAIKKTIEQDIGNRQGQRTELMGNSPEVKQGETTRDAAARLAGFGSDRTARDAEAVVDHGAPELKEAMDKGEIAISAAAAIANEHKDNHAGQRKVIPFARKKSKTTAGARASRRRKAAQYGATDQRIEARKIIRPLLASGKSFTATGLAAEYDISANVFERAAAAEQARLEAFDEIGIAADDPIRAAPYGTTRIPEKTVGIHVLIEELRPLFDRCLFQSKSHLATLSKTEMAMIAHEGKCLLDKWASDDPTVRRVRGHVVSRKTSGEKRSQCRTTSS